MSLILDPVLPVFLLMLGGALLRRRGFVSEAFWPSLERLAYYVLLPALIVATLAQSDLTRLAAGGIAIAVLGALAFVTLVLLALRRAMPVDGPGFTSMVQGALRMNTYMALAIVGRVHGEAGLAAAAITMAVLMPTVNAISVAVLVRYGHGNGATAGLAVLLRQVASNPLILACAAGALLGGTGIGLPPVLGPMLEIIGRAALPMGLIAVGAALELTAISRARIPTAITLGLKLAVLPALAWAIGYALDLDAVSLFSVVVFAGVPTATSAYILSRQLGGDAPMMAAITTTETAASALTLPVLLFLLTL